LRAAGVLFCFQTGSAANVRALPWEAGMAAAFGLPRQAALEAVTIDAARVYKMEDRVGSIEAGKRADIIITDRDPLQPTANVTAMFIAGKPVDVTDNKHTRLYEKYARRLDSTGMNHN